MNVTHTDPVATSTWIRRVVDPSGEITDEPTRYEPSRAATVATIMTRTTYCVREDVGVDTLMTLLLEHRLSGVPVVDAQGRPVGIVSKTDLLRHVQDVRDGVEVAQADEQPVLDNLGAGYRAVHVDPANARDLMTPMVFAMVQDVSIAQAAALMAGEGVHRVPIVDEDARVIGIVSTIDIARWVAEQAGYTV